MLSTSLRTRQPFKGLRKTSGAIGWSDWQKWVMDVLKNTLAFAAAGFVTLFVVDNVQAERESEKARATAFYGARIKAIQDYQAAVGKLFAHAATTHNLIDISSKEDMKLEANRSQLVALGMESTMSALYIELLFPEHATETERAISTSQELVAKLIAVTVTRKAKVMSKGRWTNLDVALLTYEEDQASAAALEASKGSATLLRMLQAAMFPVGQAPVESKAAPSAASSTPGR